MRVVRLVTVRVSDSEQDVHGTDHFTIRGDGEKGFSLLTIPEDGGIVTYNVASLCAY